MPDLDTALAAFHDARLHSISVDWLKREAVVRVMTNDEGPPRRLLLVGRGLAWFTMDPPTIEPSRGYAYAPPEGPRIDANVGLHGAGAPTGLESVATSTVTIFVSSWNSFLWMGAASFTVEEGAEASG